MKPLGGHALARAADVDLTTLGLPDADVNALQERLGGTTVKSTQLDRLALDTKLTPELKRILGAVRTTLRGTLRVAAVSHLSKAGEVAGAVDALTVRTASAPSGDAPLVAAAVRLMPDALWGHEAALPAFVKLMKDHLSEARVTPAVMALSGGAGHGKDQAVEGLKLSLEKKDAIVHEVDLAGKTDNDADALFLEGGPLSTKELNKLVSKGAVVRLLGCDALLSSAPKIALGVSKLLLAERGEANYVRLPWVLEFDVGEPRAHFNAALGTHCNDLMSAGAELGRLDGPTMVRYARAMIPQLLEAPSLATLDLEIDDAAFPLLGEALATPHAPLDKLKSRLHQFLFTRFDTETSVDRKVGTVLRLIPAALPSDEQQALIAHLHTLTPDVTEGKALFAVHDGGRRVDATFLAARKTLIDTTAQLSDRAIDQMIDWASNSQGSELEGISLLTSLKPLADQLEKLTRRMGMAEKIGRQELARPADYAACEVAALAALKATSSAVLLADEGSTIELFIRGLEISLLDTFNSLRAMQNKPQQELGDALSMD